MLSEKDLHPYQQAAVEHIIKVPRCALFLEMGLGKTISTLTAINYLMYADLEVNNVLIIAPKRVVESVWGAEAEKWEHTKHFTFSKISGTAAQRRAAMQQKADIYLLGRDNVVWFFDQKQRPDFDMLVIDESSSFKNNKSKRFKALRLYQPLFLRIVELTGTPSPNGLLDLWAPMYLLDRGQRLGRFITHYREQYFKPDKRKGAIVYSYALRKGAEKAIQDKIKDICISMKSEDYLNLPEVTTNYIRIDLPDNLQKAYKDFEEEQILELFGEGEEIAALNAAALSNKLLQFANGAIYDEQHDYKVVHGLKIDATKEILEDAAGKPVLIAYAYEHDRERLLQELKGYHPRLLKTDKDVRDWNAGKIQVMIMHPASGGHGLNLQAGGHIIVWFGQTWSLELEQQFNARLNRQGQNHPVIINKLITRGTIDEDVIKAINRKSKGQEGLMQAVKARIKAYLERI